jgi:phosphatidylglycerophosphatase A
VKLDAEQRRSILAHPAGWIASGFGSGLSPFASGTAGSLAALLPWLALRELSLPLYLVVIVAAFALGIWASNFVIGKLRVADPGVVVWDEFVGQWIALLPLLGSGRGWPWVAAGFFLFRVFDVAKPWPVSWADQSVEGGLGVMLDDVLAGVYAAIVLAVALHLF